VKTQPVPAVSRKDVVRVVRREFSQVPEAELFAILDAYGTDDWQRERDRVQLAILKLAAGDLNALRGHVETACRDYRDVLACAEYPEDFKRAPAASLVSAERARVFEADWKQYREWLARK
jgi:hypothetical protein